MDAPSYSNIGRRHSIPPLLLFFAAMLLLSSANAPSVESAVSTATNVSQKAEMAVFFENELRPIIAMKVDELITTVTSPLPVEVEIDYIKRMHADADEKYLALAPGWLRLASENALLKDGPFEHFDVAKWGQYARRVLAFEVLLDKDSEKAFAVLSKGCDIDNPSYLFAAFCGIVWSSSEGRAISNGKWQWEGSKNTWRSFLQAKNPLLRSLAFQFSDYYATSDEVACACSENINTHWSYLHQLAIEKVEKLDPEVGKKILVEYLNSDKTILAGDEAGEMHKKAQETLDRLKSSTFDLSPSGERRQP